MSCGLRERSIRMGEKLEREICSLIAKKKEGDYWDFKEKWYTENERLLHDILCFANTVHEHDCYIIIGVSDSGKIVGLTDENRIKQAGLLDLLSNVVFSGDNIPEVRLDTIEIEGKELDIITVQNSFIVPYYIKKSCKSHKKIREGYIYTRVGDKNTPINMNSSMPSIEMLWKKRLGLTQPPLFQLVKSLENKTDWVMNDETYYNIYRPEFQIIEEDEGDENEDRARAEFYVYTQANSSYTYTNLKLMCNQTILKEFQIITLDSGRYLTTTPTWGFCGYDEWKTRAKYAYKYYLKDSITYKLQQFLYDDDKSEAEYAKDNYDRVILYFDNEDERICFQNYIERNQKKLDVLIEEENKVYFEIHGINEKDNENIRFKLSTGLALNKLLIEYRMNKL